MFYVFLSVCLQTFIDYNLYGMNMINLAAVKFRRKSPQEEAGKRTLYAVFMMALY